MKTKKKTKKYEELPIKIRDLIKSITKNSDEYDYEKFMKFKLNFDDELPLNKTVEIPTITTVRAIFLENKYYPQVFLAECLYKI